MMMLLSVAGSGQLDTDTRALYTDGTRVYVRGVGPEKMHELYCVWRDEEDASPGTL